MSDALQPYEDMSETLHRCGDFNHVANLHTFSETES